MERAKMGMRLSIAHKFALLTALLVAGTAIVQGLVLYEVAAKGFLELEQSHLSVRVKDSARNLVPDFEDLRRDALFMIERPVSVTLMQVETHGGQFENNNREDTYRRVVVLFTAFLRANPAYTQVSYIGAADGGRELIRVEREDDRITVVNDRQLRRLEGDPDFDRAIKLAPGKVHLTDIALRRQGDKLVEPYQAAVRSMAPVFTADNKPFGVISVEADAGQWMNDLAQSVTGADALYLTNEKGDLLLHPDRSKTFGFDLGGRHLLTDEFPAVDPIYRNVQQEEVRYLGDRSVVYAFKIHFDPEIAERFLVMAVSSPKDVLLASTREMGNWSIYITLAMIMVGLVGSRFLSRPLAELMTSARRIASGDVFANVKKEEASSEEVQVLVDAFRVMTGAVQDRETSLRETEATTSAILQSAGNSILTVSENGTIDSANRAALLTFGYAWRELLGSRLSMLLPAADGEDAAFIRRSIGTSVEGTALRRDGSSIPVLITVAEVPLALRKIFTIVLADLTEVKKADRAKNDFISVVSHELRTPLTSIRGALGLLTSKPDSGMPTQTRQLLEIAFNNSERLVKLINDILDMEKLGAGRLQLDLRAHDAEALLLRAIEANAPYGERFGVRFILDHSAPGITVRTDVDRFMQVMANLLSNAAKFSPAGSQVEIATEMRGAYLRISVTDHGEGIPEAIRPKLFEKFVQGDNSDARRYEGTGLGLSITRELVRVMHGAIAFESEVGRGTTFHVDLPLGDVPPLSAQTVLPKTARRQLLVCEDDASVAFLWKELLEDAGYNVATAGTMGQALEQVGERSFDAILIDLMLPDGNGIDLIRRLRADPKSRDIPVVVVSARAELGWKEINGDAINVADWLSKPVSPSRLQSVVADAIARAPSQRPRVLHVEDDADSVKILNASLGDRANITAVGTLAEAKSKLSAGKFDLVVLDLGLPDGSGTELLRDLNRPEAEPTPVIVLSGREADEETRRQVVASLVKSRLPQSKIVDIIGSHLERRRA
jgi:PAS domain S-box-containing protein